MSCIVWNCQGLGHHLAVQSLCNLIKVTRAQLVFLSETKATCSYMNNIRMKLGFSGGLHVERHGYGGGLSLMWTDSLDVTITSYSQGHIDSIVKDHLGLNWRFTGFYGHPRKEERHHSWTLLRRLSTLNSLPWLCSGDFNEIMFHGEKDGIRPSSIAQMEAFKSAVDESELHDLGISNGTYTWFGKRHSKHVREKLDRALVNQSWKSLFPYSTASICVTTKSDHFPLVITFERASRSVGTSRNYVHRFETFWTQDDECREIIDYQWQPCSATNSQHLMDSIHRTRRALKTWSAKKYGSLPQSIQRLRAQIHELLQTQQPNFEEILKCQRQLQDMEAKEEDYWRQRSRAEWLQNELHDLEFAKLSPASKQFLQSPYSPDDVQKAVKDLPSTKAPGSDGMQLIFLKKYWDIFGPEVTTFVLEFLNNGGDLAAINHTLICLLPMVKHATKVTEYRPISLCNSIYKLISRILVNRLKLVIGEVIDCAQSAFAPGRLLTDNVAIACEAFHMFKTQTASSRQYVAIKVDMAKAFHKVQWHYLSEIMHRMEFPHVFISRIMFCISSATLSLLINGGSTTAFQPTCGIRQGDPLSPFLFILCAEGFSALICKEVRYGAWKSLSFGAQGASVSHLFFANDSLLFTEANKSSIEAVQRVLLSYQRMSGQRINFSKSTIYCSQRVPSSIMSNYCSTLGMAPGANDSLYLGLPFLIGRSKKKVFQFVTDRVRKKINGWKEKFLTPAGKEILIKSIVEAIPNHVMQCYLLPDCVCYEIVALTRKFWWGRNTTDNSICWKSWDSMCDSKGNGGMGFKDIQAKNLAFLAKQGWRLLTKPDSLIAQVFKARYYPQTSFMNASLGAKPSYLWRSFIEGRKVLELGIRHQVGTGQTIQVWEDRWVPQPFSFKLSPINRFKFPNAMVQDLILPEDNRWNEDLLENLVLPHEMESILQIPLCPTDIHDRVVWHHTHNGEYTVKSGYTTLKRWQESQSGCSSSNLTYSKKSLWNVLWSWPTWPRIRHFMWRAMHNNLPLGANLAKRKIDVVYCPLCFCLNEIDKHLFLDCAFACKVWKLLGFTTVLSKLKATSFLSLVTLLVQQLDEDMVTLFFATTWLIWKARCCKYFENKTTQPAQLVSKALAIKEESSAKAKVRCTDMQLESNWLRPPLGVFTVNVDASVHSEGHVGYGVIIRNSRGSIIGAESGPLQKNISVEHAELQSIQKGMLLARSLQLGNLQICTDSRLAINRLNSTDVDHSLVSPLVYHFRKLQTAFNETSLHFVRREGNKPAHLLANLGVAFCKPINWGSKPPDDVISAVTLDSLSSNE